MHWHLKVGNVVCRFARTSNEKTWLRYAPNSKTLSVVPCKLKHDHPCSGSTLNYWSQ